MRNVPMKDAALIVLAAATLAATTTSASYDLAQGGLLVAGNYAPNAGGQALQMVIPISTFSQNVVTISGAPTGGTFTLSANVSGNTQTTAGIAYNANAATIAAAVIALSNIGPGNVTVSGTGPFVVNFSAGLAGAVTLTASAAGLTGGSPAITVGVPTYAFTVNVSADGTNWTQQGRTATVLTDTANPLGDVLQIDFSATARYVQLVATLSGTGASI